MALAAALVVLTGISFLGTSGSSSVTVISPAKRPGGLAGGVPALVTPVATNFTTAQGQSQQISGVQLFTIQVAESKSDSLNVHLLWLNPQDSTQVLKNPNSYIQVGLYYQATCTGQITLSDGVTTVCPAAGSNSAGSLTKANADVVLRTTTAAQQYLYVLATIYVPGGAPPGQQSNLTALRFNLDVRAK